MPSGHKGVELCDELFQCKKVHFNVRQNGRIVGLVSDLLTLLTPIFYYHTSKIMQEGSRPDQLHKVHFAGNPFLAGLMVLTCKRRVVANVLSLFPK